MMRRLEVVSAADERIEVPTGELQARQEPQRAVRGEVAGALGRAQARGGGAVDRRDRPGEPDRRERIAGCAAQLDAEPVAVPSHRPGCVHGALSPVGRIDRRLQIVRPRQVAVQREPCRQTQAPSQVGAITRPPAAVYGVARVARQREAGKRAPGAAALELPRTGNSRAAAPGARFPASRWRATRATPYTAAGGRVIAPTWLRA